MKYDWRNGTRGINVSPDVAGPELDRIQNVRKEPLQAQHIVDAARPEHAPLHPAFEWNDAVAAEQYRLDQARYIIRAIVVVPEKGEKVQPTRHVYVHVRDAYYPVRAVVEQPDLFKEALKELLGKVASAQNAVTELRSVAQETSLAPRRIAGIEKADRGLTDARSALEDLKDNGEAEAATALVDTVAVPA